MPWNVLDVTSLRREFVELALQDGANRRELCRRLGISAQTGYKWLRRYEREGLVGLADRSRRPARSPARTDLAMEDRVLALGEKHPAWGGRKLSKRISALAHSDVPAPSTVTAILHRHGQITPEATERAQNWHRFEHEEPNALWKMDFKGDFPMLRGRCYPLIVVDDHSRFNVVLGACSRIHTNDVQTLLTDAFRRYGLPLRINTDNGPPFGVGRRGRGGGLATLNMWLI